MRTDSLSWRKFTARVLVKLAAPTIDGYLSVVCRSSSCAKLSPQEIAETAAPRFVDVILGNDEQFWPDFPDLILAEVKCHIVKRLTINRA